MIKVTQFHVVHFKTFPSAEKPAELPREAILLYALGEDGVIYEFSTQTWMPLAIEEDCLKEPPWKNFTPNNRLS